MKSYSRAAAARNGIAGSGYGYTPGVQSPIAFFPTYPMTVRGIRWLIGDDQVAGSLIAVLCGAATAVLFAQWVWRRLPRAGAATAIAVLLLYPYAFYLYGAMYGESLFMLTAIGSFLLLERRHYWLAGLVGALATAGRHVGVAVAVGLVVRMLEMLAEHRALSAAVTSVGTAGTAGTVGTAGLGADARHPLWRELLFLSRSRWWPRPAISWQAARRHGFGSPCSPCWGRG